MNASELKLQIIGLLNKLEVPHTQIDTAYHLIALILMAFVAWLTFVITFKILNSKVTKLVLSTKNQWDDALASHHFFHRMAHMVPAVAIQLLNPVLFDEQSTTYSFLEKASVIYLILAAIGAGNAVFNTIQDTYNESDLAKRVPIDGFVQVGKLVLAVIAILLIVAKLMNTSPALLLSGLGAVTAIIILVFRDTILGFVAGINIVANRMVNNGDWIEMPKYQADGTVIGVGLTTVKVQNWDNTISTIPTYALISDSVKNWRGMEESGGRRIKRAIHLDIKSIKFCDEEMLQRFSNIRCIADYINNKKEELQKDSNDKNLDANDLLNARQLTNIGTLRAYMVHYLKNHPQINQDLTLLVRQLAPTEVGLPIEIYCFCKDKAWVNYEGIQADIFDHLFAMLPTFELEAYQRVSDNRQFQ